jgi:hypothetical protein
MFYIAPFDSMAFHIHLSSLDSREQGKLLLHEHGRRNDCSVAATWPYICMDPKGVCVCVREREREREYDNYSIAQRSDSCRDYGETVSTLCVFGS